MRVLRTERGHRIEGDDADVSLANRFLEHLGARGFAASTVRTYAFCVLSFLRFCDQRHLALADVVPTDVFEFLDWLAAPERRDTNVIRLRSGSGAAPATLNQRIAVVRALFEYAVVTGERADSPVPTARRSMGAGRKRRGLLGHLSSGPRRGGGRLVRQPHRLPEALDPEDVAAFIADLDTHRDRAMALLMLLGGLRASEVRGLLLADVDMGLRRLRVVGKGNRARVVPVERAFFAELVAYLNTERPQGCTTAECFVVLRGPTRGGPLSEAGLRKIFRTHRSRSGAVRVRPHRLRHTYGTELAAAGIDLLVLRALMGHASPETTAGYVHLSPEALATEYERARASSA